MSQELSTEILKRADSLVKYLADTLEKSGNFVLEQAPDIIQQYVLYGRISTTISVLASLLFIFASWYLIYRVGIKDSWKLGTERCGDWAIGRSAATAVGAIIMLPLSILAFLSYIHDMILVWAAPKVWLIQELAKLVK